MLLKLRRLFQMVGRDGLVLFYVCRQAATPPWVRVAALGMVLYVLSPIDLISDFLPILGWADDFALLVFGIPWLLKKVPIGTLTAAQELAAQRWSRFGFRNS